MCPQGLIHPAQGILHSGEPLITEYEVLTATMMYPGRLVISDTNAWDIKVADSGSALVLGVLDVEATEERSTIYGAGDQARVLSGPIVVLLKKDSGGALAIGSKVSPANSGMVQLCPSGQEFDVIGRSLEVIAKETKADVLVALEI